MYEVETLMRQGSVYFAIAFTTWAATSNFVLSNYIISYDKRHWADISAVKKQTELIGKKTKISGDRNI